MNDNIRERVEKGAAWLDSILPDWYKYIDKDKVCMESAYQCIAGQLGLYLNQGYTNPYVGFLNEYAPVPNQHKHSHNYFLSQNMLRFAENHGFCTIDTQIYTDLKSEWIEQINLRLNNIQPTN